MDKFLSELKRLIGDAILVLSSDKQKIILTGRSVGMAIA